MIETRVRIVAMDYGIAWVEPSEQSGCGACQAKSACGVSGLGKYFSRRQQTVPVMCKTAAKVGDELLVAVDEAELIKAGVLVYLLPMILAVLGASLMAGLGDAAAVAGMALGIVVGLVIARRVGRTPRMQARPLSDSIAQGETP
ncbi:MAG: SoxR reducing system RseC family protein [Betaproteobacteria bacterium]|nr:SoxR reducing system RseC family protein [Betaproteobacteria bacterium]